MTAFLPGEKIDIPLPPEAVEAFGYRGDARFVSFRYVYDDLWFDDGRSAGSANSWVFQGFARHRAVSSLLDPHDLGGSDRAAPFALVIDREQNRAAIVPTTEAKEFLRSQWPPEPPLTAQQQEEVRRIYEQLVNQRKEQPLDHEAINRSINDQRGRVGRLMSWLDMCPSAERGRS